MHEATKRLTYLTYACELSHHIRVHINGLNSVELLYLRLGNPILFNHRYSVLGIKENELPGDTNSIRIRVYYL